MLSSSLAINIEGINACGSGEQFKVLHKVNLWNILEIFLGEQCGGNSCS